MKGFEWCDFKFDEDMFPDARGQIKRIKERGNHVSNILFLSLWTCGANNQDLLLDQPLYCARIRDL